MPFTLFSRVAFGPTSLLYMQLSQLLPLQLWSAEEGIVSWLKDVSIRELLCKVFTVTALGVLQPFVLLLAGFMCSHALRCALMTSSVCEVHVAYNQVVYYKLHAGTRRCRRA